MSQAADKVASTVGRTSAMVNGAGHRHHRNLGGIHQATRRRPASRTRDPLAVLAHSGCPYGRRLAAAQRGRA